MPIILAKNHGKHRNRISSLFLILRKFISSLTPIPPKRMNNEETNVIPISEACNSALILGIPGNYL
jgi:hypothetical protein